MKHDEVREFIYERGLLPAVHVVAKAVGPYGDGLTDAERVVWHLYADGWLPNMGAEAPNVH